MHQKEATKLLVLHKVTDEPHRCTMRHKHLDGPIDGHTLLTSINYSYTMNYI